MLTVLGFAMIATFLVLIMTKKMSPFAALVLIPALFCVAVGQGAKLGDYVIDGVGNLAPTAAMLMFAIVYFGVMIDVGLFDPIVRGILRFSLDASGIFVPMIPALAVGLLAVFLLAHVPALRPDRGRMPPGVTGVSGSSLAPEN